VIYFIFIYFIFLYAFLFVSDAHQGNGYATDKLNGLFDELEVRIMDMYNPNIYPFDYEAAKMIDVSVHLSNHIQNTEYLSLLNKYLHIAMNKYQPQMIIYNAGTDCLIGDPLGEKILQKYIEQC
jgi:histone deacetylase 11